MQITENVFIKTIKISEEIDVYIKNSYITTVSRNTDLKLGFKTKYFLPKDSILEIIFPKEFKNIDNISNIKIYLITDLINPLEYTIDETENKITIKNGISISLPNFRMCLSLISLIIISIF